MTPRDAGTADLPAAGGAGCGFCGTRPGPHRRAEATSCGARQCEMRRVQEAARRVFQRDWHTYCQRQRQSVVAAARQLAAALRLLREPPDNVPIGAVPRLDRPLAPLPAARREAFAAHLETIVADAFAAGEPAPDLTRRETAEPPEHPVIAASCATCAGACCMIGGIRNAFLTVDTIQLYRARNPDAAPDAIVAHFLSRLPERSVEHSCVYHDANGCALSRRERADICNRYHCNPQRDLLRRYREMGAQQAVIIACEDGTEPAVGLLEPEGGWRPLPRGATDGIGAEEASRGVAAALAQMPTDPRGEPRTVILRGSPPD